MFEVSHTLEFSENSRLRRLKAWKERSEERCEQVRKMRMNGEEKKKKAGNKAAKKENKNEKFKNKKERCEEK